jgi:hypothetical protein
MTELHGRTVPEHGMNKVHQLNRAIRQRDSACIYQLIVKFHTYGSRSEVKLQSNSLLSGTALIEEAAIRA